MEYSHKLGVWKELFLWGLESHPLIAQGKGYFGTWQPNNLYGLQIIQIKCHILKTTHESLWNELTLFD